MLLPSPGVSMGKAYTWTAMHTFTASPTSATFTGVVQMGAGAGAQITLGAHLDQDDVLIKRDVDGDGSTYNEAGSLLHLWRDVTNVGTEAGNFLECSTDGAAPRAYIDQDGNIIATQGGGVSSSMNANGHIKGSQAVRSPRFYPVTPGSGLNLCTHGAPSDTVVGTLTIYGGSAYASATTNKTGGLVDIYSGNGDGAAGQTAAHGGQLKLHGGNAASDLDSSNGGDVLIYGGTLGTNGTPGVDGSVRITDADGATNRIECDETGIGFFAATPVTQRLKASYNNWAAVGDVVDALVALGLFDQA